MATATRCSSLPRLMACPQSGNVEPGALAISGQSDAASLGSAVHELLAAHVRTGEYPTDEQKREVALRFNVENDRQLGYLTWTGYEAWRELRKWFEPDPMVEVSLEYRSNTLTLTGRSDVAKDADGVVRGLDWKSGYKPSDYYHQMAGYAFLLLREFPAAQKAALTLVWLREKLVDTLVWTRANADEWFAEMEKRLTSGVFSPGESCRFCPRQLTCPARTAMVKSTLADLVAADASLPELTAETWSVLAPQMSQAWERVKLVESAIVRFRAVVRDGVDKFGPLAVSDRTQIALVPCQPRKSLDTVKAWPVLAERLSDAEMATCTTVSLSAAQQAVSDRAERGAKKEARESLLAALRAAGAIIEEQQQPRMMEVRKNKTEEVEICQ